MGNIRLYLRPNEKLYVNGAVIRFDRKVSIELLNDVTFLLENHVMQADQATTPLKQLYFVVQMMLMDPANSDAPRRLFDSMHAQILDVLRNETLRNGVNAVEEDVRAGNEFNALKTLRKLFPIEETVMAGNGAASADDSGDAERPGEAETAIAALSRQIGA